MSYRYVLIAFAVLALMGCSGSEDASAALADDASETVGDATDAPSSTSTSTTTTTTSPTTVPTSAVEAEGASAPATGSVAPARPFEPLPESGPSETAAWISRRSMSADVIEMVWSAPEGAASYEVHRVANQDGHPANSAMTSATRIHAFGPDESNGVFIDDDLAEGELYWYGVRSVDGDGQVLSVGWHETAAVTDEEPPSAVAASVEVGDQGILVSWDMPEENFRLHSYRVFRSVDGGEFEHVSSTWNIDQTSLLDDDPPSGVVTYSVVTLDFHWNESEPGTVTVDLS